MSPYPFACFLQQPTNSTQGKLSTALEYGIDLAWEDVYDFVNRFGDHRGGAFDSVWTFDLEKDVMFLTKNDQTRSTPLELARERLFTLDDFDVLSSPRHTFLEEETLPGLYWEPETNPPPRVKSLLSQVLRELPSHSAMSFEGK